MEPSVILATLVLLKASGASGEPVTVPRLVANAGFAVCFEAVLGTFCSALATVLTPSPATAATAVSGATTGAVCGNGRASSAAKGAVALLPSGASCIVVPVAAFTAAVRTGPPEGND